MSLEDEYLAFDGLVPGFRVVCKLVGGLSVFGRSIKDEFSQLFPLMMFCPSIVAYTNFIAVIQKASTTNRRLALGGSCPIFARATRSACCSTSRGAPRDKSTPKRSSSSRYNCESDASYACTAGSRSHVICRATRKTMEFVDLLDNFCRCWPFVLPCQGDIAFVYHFSTSLGGNSLIRTFGFARFDSINDTLVDSLADGGNFGLNSSEAP
ncbi:hypothetical protein AG1IA_03724 [Rhizoctonia solani AG-1 IA]|uniref:Uncharacterized protein n=1 Tax=Thanatephorus cucumeris (strain AG1-IA) TaxID=983506 RepID=L8WZJ9_THACA|nr:hypothetical protein AG1IA_03724 [Rhizoctonia solani AG-1 IA]